MSFWSASSPRDVETAAYFAGGLFGRYWSEAIPEILEPTARLHIIPELPSRGGNTLTPSDSCLNYLSNKTHGHDLGYAKLAEWQAVLSRPICARLSAENPDLQPPDFSPVEIYSMMELCGFEILVRGSSPWCSLFSREEWEDFEYARDVLHFYRAGPGNMYAGVMGGLWLDAIAELLVQDSKESSDVGSGGGTGEVYASFVHDGDIVPVLAALGIFDEEDAEQVLPTDHVKRNRRWRTSDLVPMAGRLVIERLNCRTPHGWRYRDVRLFINDGWVGWAVDGGGRASTGEEKRRRTKTDRVFVPQVEVGRFREMVRRKKEEFGSFTEVCGLAEGVEERIGFLHQ